MTIHVVATQSTVEGRSDAPGYLVGNGELIPAELVAELAHERITLGDATTLYVVRQADRHGAAGQRVQVDTKLTPVIK